ncbi:MAG: 4Fe-4S binding protein [Alistipes sp.]|nr:4Fe-4S binding protein [Candidatus Alistipes equi]
MNHFIEEWFEKRGLKAFSPYASDRFRYVFEPGTADNIENKKLSFTSNWSERHVAYISGMGTFGLSKGLITKRGVSGRYGSVITNVDFPITKRDYEGLYDYCTMCGKCIEQCPANAISFENGKDHHKCSSYFDTVRIKYAPRFGCGKCQVTTPCERGIPTKAKK